MMEEENAFEILADYAKSKSSDYETNESYKRFYFSQNDPSSSTKYVTFKIEGEFVFLAKDSYAAKAYTGSTFSGLYTSIDLDPSLSCKVYIKDKWDFLFFWNHIKTGNKQIDNKLTFFCNKKKIAENLMTENETALFEALNKKIKPLTIIIEQNYLPEIHALKNKMLIGLESNQWIYDTSQMDVLLEKGVKLLSNIKKNISKTDTVSNGNRSINKILRKNPQSFRNIK